jgi:hypothetical protein
MWDKTAKAAAYASHGRSEQNASARARWTQINRRTRRSVLDDEQSNPHCANVWRTIRERKYETSIKSEKLDRVSRT